LSQFRNHLVRLCSFKTCLVYSSGNCLLRDKSPFSGSGTCQAPSQDFSSSRNDHDWVGDTHCVMGVANAQDNNTKDTDVIMDDINMEEANSLPNLDHVGYSDFATFGEESISVNPLFVSHDISIETSVQMGQAENSAAADVDVSDEAMESTRCNRNTNLADLLLADPIFAAAAESCGRSRDNTPNETCLEKGDSLGKICDNCARESCADLNFDLYCGVVITCRRKVGRIRKETCGRRREASSNRSSTSNRQRYLLCESCRLFLTSKTGNLHYVISTGF
jgi:hypothetical protein